MAENEETNVTTEGSTEEAKPFDPIGAIRDTHARAMEGDAVSPLLQRIPLIGGALSGAYEAGATVVRGGMDMAEEALAPVGEAVMDEVMPDSATGTVGGVAGALLGAKAGFAVGGSVGAAAGGVGAFVGAPVGGLIGAVGGFFAGGKAGDYLGETNEVARTVNEVGEGLMDAGSQAVEGFAKYKDWLLPIGAALGGSLLLGNLTGGGLNLGSVAPLAAVAFVGYNLVADTELGQKMKSMASDLFGAGEAQAEDTEAEANPEGPESVGFDADAVRGGMNPATNQQRTATREAVGVSEPSVDDAFAYAM